ncbi:hypothetical protein PAAL109150_03760 [Paenibacillus alkaliterrae]|uniref:hypothetical protein n=1 Tax=Paenibacillus alkaliterrae TaxID=320909 RepID=UPI002E203AE5
MSIGNRIAGLREKRRWTQLQRARYRNVIDVRGFIPGHYRLLDIITSLYPSLQMEFVG